MTVTFLCCYNNDNELNSMLLPSFSKLNQSLCNLILINSKERGYRSAAQAYNRTIEQHKSELGDILVFCHQDIAFDNTSFLNNIITELSHDPLQILGLAGIRDDGHVVSNLKYHESQTFITRNQLKEKTRVAAVDECCFAMTKDTFHLLHFDERVCNHWHLYAVELCYNARRNGISSYIIPDEIYHKKNGDGGLYCDKHFLATTWRLTRKYHKEHRYIYAPCYVCSTNIFQAAIKIIRTTIKNLLKQ